MLRKYVPSFAKPFARRLLAGWKRIRSFFSLPVLKSRSGINVHLGCGDDILPGFVNIDSRATRAADYVVDLNEPHCFGQKTVAMFYSHAFFEHLYRNKRLPHLRCLVRALQPEGACCYIGLPYFKNIARMYLENGPGVVGPSFDLYNVYRYTHGDPETAPHWWLEQLHKSLFDEDEVAELLSQAGFVAAATFSYCYVGEENKPVNLGFFATVSDRSCEMLQLDCLQFLSQHAANKVLLDTVQFVSVGLCAGSAACKQLT